jgi:transcriptional regulator with XRE-family HTH domain
MDAIRAGHSVRALRQRRGWRQVDLAARSGLSQSDVSRIELGQLDAIAIAKLERTVGALGGTLDVRVRWNGESLDRLLDAAHAAGVEATVHLLQRAGWSVAPEVTFAIRGERGSIDVLAWRPATADLLVVEVKSVIPDLQSMLASLDRKVRLGPMIARDRGLRARRLSRLLIVSDSSTNRRRVDAHGAILTAAVPWRGRVMLRWLQRPPSDGLGIAGLLFLSTQVATTRRRQRVRKSISTEVPRSETTARGVSSTPSPSTTRPTGR